MIRRVLVGLWASVAAFFVAAPLVGWPHVTRVAIVLAAALVVSAALAKPWRWTRDQLRAVAEWDPSRRTIWISAAIAFLLLFWLVLTRFESASINAVDFTVYYDRPMFQTLSGRPLFVETADDPLRAQQSYFSVHAHWILLPLTALYAIHATPLWLLAIAGLAIVGGAVNVFAIVRRLGGGGVVASAAALAFVLNANTARMLNYGFHVEALYAWLIPLLINLALARKRAAFLLAALACVAVKEDAFMFLGAVSITVMLLAWRSLTKTDKLIYLIVPPTLALVNVVIYYKLALPYFRPGGEAVYADYWRSYGATPVCAALGMLSSPLVVAKRIVTSGFLKRVIVPHLFLPFVGWRWFIGVAPVAALYGASDNAQLHDFGIYYAIVLVPFMVLASAAGALAIAQRVWTDAARVRIAAASGLIAGALLAGLTDAGYTLRPWKSEVAAMPAAIEALSSEPLVLVQSGLYPHAGYDSRVRLLTQQAIADPSNRGAVALIAQSVNAWPLDDPDRRALERLPLAAKLLGGLVAVRLPLR